MPQHFCEMFAHKRQMTTESLQKKRINPCLVFELTISKKVPIVIYFQTENAQISHFCRNSAQIIKKEGLPQ